MTRDSFTRMIELLRNDPSARRQLLHDPESVLHGNDIAGAAGVDEGPFGDARTRGDEVARTIAQLGPTAEALKVADVAARKIFGDDYDVEVSVLGFALLEQPKSKTLEVTATGTTKCTWDPWDGCSGDVDW